MPVPTRAEINAIIPYIFTNNPSRKKQSAAKRFLNKEAGLGQAVFYWVELQ